MKPYIVKFLYHEDDGAMNGEEMFLCLRADDPRDAQEKFVQVTGGESRNCRLVSVTTKDKIELFWSRTHWQFFTIPTD